MWLGAWHLSGPPIAARMTPGGLRATVRLCGDRAPGVGDRVAADRYVERRGSAGRLRRTIRGGGLSVLLCSDQPVISDEGSYEQEVNVSLF